MLRWGNIARACGWFENGERLGARWQSGGPFRRAAAAFGLDAVIRQTPAVYAEALA
jgi:hypothetical protein